MEKRGSMSCFSSKKKKREGQYNLKFYKSLISISGAPQVALVVKNPPANVGDITDSGSIPGLERSPGGEHGNPLQYSCLENPMDREAWQATVNRAAESDTTEAT